MAMRVYELAKKLGIENRVLIPELKKMGVSVSSHSSTLDDDIVQKALDKLASKSKGHGAGHETELGAKPTENASHGRSMSARSHVVEEPSKPDKRRILIKRKKEDEPLDAIVSAPIVESERSAQPTPSITVAASPLAVEHPSSEDVINQSLPTEESPAEISPPSPAPLVAKQPEMPAKPAVVPPTIAAPTVESVTGKKKSMAFEAIEAEGQKDKLKKARKVGRPRDDQ